MDIEAERKMFDLTPVILWLENGCDAREAAKELRIYRDRMAESAKALTPYEVLKDQFDELLAENRRMAVALAASDHIGDGSEKIAQQEPVGHIYTMEALVPGSSVKYHAQIYKVLPPGTKLYAAPPPSAAPALSDEEIGEWFADWFGKFPHDHEQSFTEERIKEAGRALLAKVRT